RGGRRARRRRTGGPALPGRAAVGLRVASNDLVAIDAVVLRTLVLDLDRAQHAAQARRVGPAGVVGERVQQPASIGVAAAGRVDRARDGDRRDLGHAARLVDARTVRAARDDQRLDALGDLRLAPPGALDEQRRLVVVDGDRRGGRDERTQGFAVEHRQALTRVEDVWNAGLDELARVLQHRVAAVRRHDAERGGLAVAL